MSADYSQDSNDYYKRQKNKKDFKCNWSSEEVPCQLIDLFD